MNHHKLQLHHIMCDLDLLVWIVILVPAPKVSLSKPVFTQQEVSQRKGQTKFNLIN